MSDDLEIKIQTLVEGRNELEKAVADLRKLIGTVEKGDTEMRGFSKQLDEVAKSLRDVEKASQQTKTPEYLTWDRKYTSVGKEILSVQNKMRDLMAEIDLLANKDDPLKRAFDPSKQKDLDDARAKLRELSGTLDGLTKKQEAVRQQMSEMREAGTKYNFINYDKLIADTDKLRDKVTGIAQDVNKVQQERSNAERKAAEEAERAAKIQQGAYGNTAKEITDITQRISVMDGEIGKMSSAILNASAALKNGTKIPGKDLEAFAMAYNVASKSAQELTDRTTELRTKILSLKGTVPDDVYEYLRDGMFDAEQEVNVFNSRLSSLHTTAQTTFGSLLDKYNEISESQKKISEIDIGKALALNDENTINSYNSLVASINGLVGGFKELVDTSNMQMSTNEQLGASWLEIDQLIKELSADAEQLVKNGYSEEDSQAYQELKTTLVQLKAASAQYTKEAKKTIKTEEKSAKATKQYKSNVKELSSALKDAKQNFEKMNKTVSKITGSIGSKLKGGLKTIMKYVLGFRSLFFLVRKIRGMIKEGLDNLVQFQSATNETNHQMTELQSSLLFLKNAFGAMIAPVLNVVLPVLNMLIDTLANVGNAIARFFARLTGQATVIQAVKVGVQDYADSLKDAGKAAGSAAKKTKDLHDRLAPFDDLQVLGVDKDKDRGGSGGGGGASPEDLLPDPNEMFKRIQTESNLADMLKAAWENQDFSGVGRIAGLKIKEAFDNIDWDSIRGGLSKGISSFTSFINGFIQTPGLFASAGRNMAESLNTLTGALDQFFNEIDFFNNAKSIGEGFTEFFTNIDFGQVASALSGALKSLPETIAGFLAGVNWEKVGKSLYNGIISFIKNLDIAGINKSLGKVLGYLIKGIAGLAKGIGEELTKDIKAYFEENSLEDILKDIFSVITGDAMLNWVIENLAFPFAQGMLEALGASESDIETVSTKVKEVLTHPFSLALAKIKQIFSGIGEWFNEHVIQPIVNFFTPIITTISTIFKTLLSIIVGIWITLATWFNDNVVQPIVEFFAPIVETVSTFFSDLWEDIKEIWDTVSTWFDEHVIQPVVGFFKDLYDDAYDYFSDLWADIKEVWTDASTWFDEHVIQPIVELFSGIADSVKEAFNGVLGAVESLLNTVLDGLNDFIGKLNEWGAAGAELLNIEYTDIPEFESITIPRLAMGAVIPPNREFLAMLGDQKSGTNIEAPLDTIVDAFREVVGNLQVENTGSAVMEVDGQTFARLMTPYVVSELGRRGYDVKIIGG